MLLFFYAYYFGERRAQEVLDSKRSTAGGSQVYYFS